jgi:hypothetical protein
MNYISQLYPRMEKGPSLKSEAISDGPFSGSKKGAFGVWVCAPVHAALSEQYNRDWDEFFDDNTGLRPGRPAREKVFEEGAILTDEVFDEPVQGVYWNGI